MNGELLTIIAEVQKTVNPHGKLCTDLDYMGVSCHNCPVFTVNKRDLATLYPTKLRLIECRINSS